MQDTSTDSAPLRPGCVVCSKAWSEEWSERQRIPGLVPVDRATIMREHPGRGYLAVVHCHGADAIVEFGAETPSDNKIRSAKAFG